MRSTKLTLFVVSKDEWDTKEGTGKSIKSTFYAGLKASDRQVGRQLASQ